EISRSLQERFDLARRQQEHGVRHNAGLGIIAEFLERRAHGQRDCLAVFQNHFNTKCRFLGGQFLLSLGTACQTYPARGFQGGEPARSPTDGFAAGRAANAASSSGWAITTPVRSCKSTSRNRRVKSSGTKNSTSLSLRCAYVAGLSLSCSVSLPTLRTMGSPG